MLESPPGAGGDTIISNVSLAKQNKQFQLAEETPFR